MVYLKEGSSGELVIRLQTVLNFVFRVSPPLAVDGVFGPKTASAVLAFQRHARLAADGVVGPQTSKALISSHIAHEAQRAPQRQTLINCRASSKRRERLARRCRIKSGSQYSLRSFAAGGTQS
jgi:peptidoglycan hydrolase-like protein with peptidoglycan-binding domain